MVGSRIMIVTNRTIPVAQEFTGMGVEPDPRGNNIIRLEDVYKMSSPL